MEASRKSCVGSGAVPEDTRSSHLGCNSDFREIETPNIGAFIIRIGYRLRVLDEDPTRLLWGLNKGLNSWLWGKLRQNCFEGI